MSTLETNARAAFPLALKRRSGWDLRLMAVIDAHRRQPFSWGDFDCATFFNDAVDAVADFRPLVAHMPWDSEGSARRRLVAAGYRDMAGFCRTFFPEIPTAQARRGDVGFAEARHALSCPAVIVGAEAVTRNEHGWLVVPASLLVQCFKIG